MIITSETSNNHRLSKFSKVYRLSQILEMPLKGHPRREKLFLPLLRLKLHAEFLHSHLILYTTNSLKPSSFSLMQ